MMLILETSLIMSVVVVLLLILGRLLDGKVSPAVRYFCWVIVAVGLLVPFRPALLMLSLPERVQETVVVPVEAFIQQPVEVIREAPREVPQPAVGGTPVRAVSEAEWVVAEAERVAAVVPAASVYEAAAVRREISVSPRQVITGLWGLGAVLFALFCVGRHLQFVRNLKKFALPLDSGVEFEMLAQIRRQVGVGRKIRLMSCPLIAVPVVFGVFRPYIILPEYDVVPQRDKLRLMLLHEVLHIKLGHLNVRVLCLAALAVHWFNPLVHLMNRAALEESEQACDDEVILYSGSRSRACYGETLMLAARQHAALKFTSAYALTGGGRKLKSRLQNIMFRVKPKRWVLAACTFLMLTTVVPLTMVSCGEAQETQAAAPGTDEIFTLTVMARNAYNEVLTRAAQSMAREWNNEGRGFRMEFINYCPLGREEQLAALQSQLMAGQGPDMFFWDGVPVWMHQASGFFADINELMEQNPNTNREDFYSHILDAWEFDGGLYIFPMSFNFSSIGISANMPQSIIDRFRQHDSISYHELLRIYLDLLNEYPEFADMAIASNNFIDRILLNLGFELADFIDFGSRTSQINDPAFVSFLEDLMLARELSPNLTHGSPFLRENEWAAYSEDFVFWLDAGLISTVLEIPDLPYLHFIPIAARDGGLRMTHHFNSPSVRGPEFVDMWPEPYWGSISILNNDNAAVAWEFTQHLISAMAFHNQVEMMVVEGQLSQQVTRQFGRQGGFNNAIRREYFQGRTEATFVWVMNEFRGAATMRRLFRVPQFAPEYARDVAQFHEALSNLEEINRMPVTLLPYLPPVLFEDVMEDFWLGFVTAQEAADVVHGRMVLWLIE